MNKAFLREPDDNGDRNCPKCGSLGVPVSSDVLTRQIQPSARSDLSDTAFFCPFARCEVAYFDLFERTAPVDRLNAPVWPKDSDALLCACFGLTANDIEDDLSEGKPTRVRVLLERAKTPAAQCAALAADGRCCVAEVQRYYLRRMNERNAS